MFPTPLQFCAHYSGKEARRGSPCAGLPCLGALWYVEVKDPRPGQPRLFTRLRATEARLRPEDVRTISGLLCGRHLDARNLYCAEC